MSKSNTDLPFSPDRILYEDNHLLIALKLAGELVQGDKTGDASLADKIKAFIKDRDHKPSNVYLGIPHRLDRPVSGAIVYTKTSKALSRMSDIFRRKAIEKTYWAIVLNAPKEQKGTLVHYMKKNEKQNKSYVVDQEKAGYKKAILHYTHLSSSDRYHLLEINLETGRHHQIRAQLASMDCIIKGDLKYGSPRSNPDGSISLHARSIAFDHPTKSERINVTAPCPNDKLWGFFEAQ